VLETRCVIDETNAGRRLGPAIDTTIPPSRFKQPGPYSVDHFPLFLVDSVEESFVLRAIKVARL